MKSVHILSFYFALLVWSASAMAQQTLYDRPDSTASPALAASKSKNDDGQNVCNAQKSMTPSTPRLRVEVTSLSQVAETYTGLKCDVDGNLYFGVAPSGVPGIRKLSPTGAPLTVFPASAPGLAVRYAGYYSLAPDRNIYQLISVPEPSRYVFVYKPDGSFKSSIKLQPGFFFTATKLAVFPSGDLFVSGLEPDKDHEAAWWPFEGIFSADGKLLKELHFPDDEDIRQMAEAGDTRVVLSPGNPSSNLAIATGSAETGPDGNVYLMRRLSPAIFYVVSADGSTRRFTVDPGDPDLLPSSMHISGNRIAILFRKELSNHQILKVTDLNGNEVATYEEPLIEGFPALGPAFICYSSSPERFTFLTTMANGKLGLKSAHP